MKQKMRNENIINSNDQVTGLCQRAQASYLENSSVLEAAGGLTPPAHQKPAETKLWSRSN